MWVVCDKCNYEFGTRKNPNAKLRINRPQCGKCGEDINHG